MWMLIIINILYGFCVWMPEALATSMCLEEANLLMVGAQAQMNYLHNYTIR